MPDLFSLLGFVAFVRTTFDQVTWFLRMTTALTGVDSIFSAGLPHTPSFSNTCSSLVDRKDPVAVLFTRCVLCLLLVRHEVRSVIPRSVQGVRSIAKQTVVRRMFVERLGR
jgi:hypothetical protein